MRKTKAKARPARQPDRSRRERFLEVAAAHINSHGVSSRTLQDVAKRLKLSRAAVYYYFEDREDLVFQVYRRSCELMARSLGAAAKKDGTACDVIQEFVSLVLAPDGPEVTALEELGLLRDAERDTVLGLYEGVIARLVRILEDGAAAGEVRACDFRVVAQTIVGTIQAFPTQVRLPGVFAEIGETGRADSIEFLNDILLRGWASDRSRKINALPIDLESLVPGRAAAFDREGLAASRREAILLVASRLFNRKGIDSTSLDEIAAELGATKRTLYAYVGDKQAIVAACYDRARRLFADLRAQVASHGSEGASQMDLLVNEMRAVAMLRMRADIEPMRRFMPRGALSARDKAATAAWYRELLKVWLASVAALRRERSMRPVDPLQLGSIVGQQASWLTKGTVPVDRESAVRIAAEIVDTYRLGIKAI